MLTRKQLDLLKYINKHLNKDGIPPSFDEMKEALDLRSKSGIHRLITALEERGFIRRLAHRARAIEIVKLPDSLETNNNVPKKAMKKLKLKSIKISLNSRRSLRIFIKILRRDFFKLLVTLQVICTQQDLEMIKL